MDESKGHICWAVIGTSMREYVRDNNGEVWWAYADQYIGENGYRVGMRFEATEIFSDQQLRDSLMARGFRLD